MKKEVLNMFEAKRNLETFVINEVFELRSAPRFNENDEGRAVPVEPLVTLNVRHVNNIETSLHAVIYPGAYDDISAQINAGMIKLMNEYANKLVCMFNAGYIRNGIVVPFPYYKK